MSTEEVPPPAAPLESDSDGEGWSIVYLRKKVLSSIREKLSKKEAVSLQDVKDLTDASDVAKEEMMVPVDCSGIGDLSKTDALVEKLGLEGLAKAFVEAEDLFHANVSKMPADFVPKEMTAEKWQELANEEASEEEEGEEEEATDSDEEVDDDKDEAGAVEQGKSAEDTTTSEPAAKKAKTSQDSAE
uniref:Uncharacterized protein n=1 Tax=Noctiluca scintillans TaxID=2966 RepID=A0A7S1F7M4_NOCSC|mmetsp:Transcript_38915/g.103421  ORF Transcript_38915/g.103421 Transcript_38915/m.103421 type:complete len:187 (+) Transcript_38915:69-629(+)